MSIEQAIAANTAAVIALTNALVATANLAPGAAADAAPSKAAGKTKGADAAPKASRDEMVAALKQLGESKSAEVAKAVIKEVGKAAKMAEIKDALVDAVYKAAKAKLEEEEEGAGDDGL
jgi:acyl-CoA reductase-like NAD-dependent aldehyde dehydrogenase